MGAISVRGIDKDLSAALKEEAKRRNTSVNGLVVDILRRELGLAGGQGRRPRHHDLDHLAGSWSTQEAEEFREATAPFEEVDEALWRTSGS
ncbi:MAG: hypothetical protein Kow00129_10520 [Thermoleophilia bacterium]